MISEKMHSLSLGPSFSWSVVCPPSSKYSIWHFIQDQQHPLKFSVYFPGDLPSSNPWFLGLEHTSAEADGKTLTGLTGIMIRATHHLITEARKYQAAFCLSDQGAIPVGRNLTAVHKEEEDFQTSCTLPTEKGGARAGQACQDQIFQQHGTNDSMAGERVAWGSRVLCTPGCTARE